MVWTSWVPMLLAQAGEAVAKTDESQMSPGMKLLMAVGILVGSFVLGHFIAQGLKLPDFGVRIGFVLFTLLAGIAICVLGWPPKLGIDLSGGVVLVYEVDRNQGQSQGLEQAVSQVGKSLSGLKGQKPTARINASGQIDLRFADVQETQGIVFGQFTGFLRRHYVVRQFTNYAG